MTDKEQNKSEVHQEPTSKHITGMNSRGKDRRRFIKRAIVAAPFILTVASRPVWAGNCTMSGQLSGNLSDAGEPCGGEGCSADYWEANTGNWHYAYQRGCVFDSVFELKIVVFGQDTLYQVISDTGGSLKKRLGRHAVTALQNSATRVSYEYMVCEVIGMVGSAFNNGIKDEMEDVEETLRELNNESVCPL